MAGHPVDEDKRSLRLAQIIQYIEQLYTDRFEEWISEHALRLDLIARPLIKSPDTERLVRNTAFAFFRPEDYPTHDMLPQMMLVAPFPEHDLDEINHLATLLGRWNEQRLVCGASTLSLTG